MASLLNSCATPGAPTGGPTDKTPPKIVSYQPENLSKNVEARTFSIIFDEWVQVSNVRQQVIVSPPVATFPDITARKNEVNVRFRDELLPNTTYSIFFGESIKDVRESNIAENTRYVFSTGPVIDSLGISGMISLPTGQSIPENTFVLLYTSLEDSAIVREKAAYAVKMTKGNDFRFDYLPAATYNLFALSDKNNNLLYDLPTEWIGAYPASIDLDTTISDLTIPLILPEPEGYKIAEYNSTLLNGMLKINWNKVYNPQNDPFDAKILNPGTIIKKPQYFTSSESEYFILSDSNTISCVLYQNNITIDTIIIKQDNRGPQTGILRTTPQAAGKYANLSLYQNQPILFQSSIPIAKLLEDKMTIEDSTGLKIPYTLSSEDSLWSFSILPQILSGQEYQLRMKDSAIVFVNQTYSKEQSFKLSSVQSAKYGRISFNISLPSADTAYMISIKTSNGKILSETFIEGDTQFVYTSPPLAAGGYLVEVLEDRNRSYTWNGGSYWKKTSPERVFRSEAVNVKENWEQEIRVVADFTDPVTPLAPPEEKENQPKQDKSPTPGNQETEDRRPMFDR